MPQKQLDESRIANELKGGSLFFQSAEPPPPEPPHEPATPAVAPVAGAVTPPVVSSPPPSSAGLAIPPGESQEPSAAQPPARPAIPPGAPPNRGTGAALERTSDGTDERSVERTKVRHSFDILSDQLLALREIAVDREKLFGSRVLLGDLVQEALDRFIARERNRD